MQAYDEIYKRIDDLIVHYEQEQNYEVCRYLLDCKMEIMEKINNTKEMISAKNRIQPPI